MEVMESEPFGPTYPIRTEVEWDLTDFEMITETFEIIWSQTEQKHKLWTIYPQFWFTTTELRKFNKNIK